MVAALLAVSCGGDPDEGAVPDEVATLEPSPTATGTDDDGTDDGQPDAGDGEDGMSTDDPETFARADAAQRAGVEPADVVVVVHEDVTWPDGSLGCPAPDQFYTQALVAGYRVVVEAGGEQFHYHGQSGQPATYCADPSEPADRGGVVDR